MSDTTSTPNYQEILDKYAADLQASSKTIPEVPKTPEKSEASEIQETPEVPQIITPIPEPTPEPIVATPPPRPEPIVVTPADSPPPEIKPKENNFFKYLFFISLIIFLGVLAAVIYSFINTQKPLSNSDATPTLQPSTAPVVMCKINDLEYVVGASFPASDSCNTCTCNPDTSISCTEKACDLTPTSSATTSANQYKNTKYKYSLTFPSSWLNKYNITETSSGTNFSYKDTPDTKTTLFSINVLTKDEWTKEQSQPHGTLIKEDTANDRVFVYSFALDTIFTGQKADDFSKMSGDIKQIISTFKFL